MDLNVQWFIQLASTDLTNEDACRKILASVGDDVEIQAYAQEMLNALVAETDDDGVQGLVDEIQEMIQTAIERARNGAPPPMFAEFSTDGSGIDGAGSEDPEEIIKIPPLCDTSNFNGEINSDNVIDLLPNISDMSDAQIAEWMTCLLCQLRDVGASDLHISADARLFVRKDLEIHKISEESINHEVAARLNVALLTPEQREEFIENQDLNFALQIGKDRFRVSLLIHKDGSAGSYRLVANEIRTLSDLGFLPDAVGTIEQLLDYHNGLILVTGSLGSGKSTTLASMIDIINQRRTDHIITVEDPIEMVIPSASCNVTQRQIGKDTKSYNAALKGALREDPDVIIIGELHDLETIENAITASETGHLVIGTLHTSNASNTLNRLLDVFPPSQQAQIRAMVAGSLRGILCQQLIPSASGGLTLGYELLVNTMAVANSINDNKMHQMSSIMEVGSKMGMCTFDQCLANLAYQGIIEKETACNMIDSKVKKAEIERNFAIKGAKELEELRLANKKRK